MKKCCDEPAKCNEEFQKKGKKKEKSDLKI